MRARFGERAALAPTTDGVMLRAETTFFQNRHHATPEDPLSRRLRRQTIFVHNVLPDRGLDVGGKLSSFSDPL
jgi:hypothetical protein